MTPAQTLLALAGRCDVRDRKLQSIIEATNMSVDSQATAIAMLVTLDLDIFRDCAAALRSCAQHDGAPS